MCAMEVRRWQTTSMGKQRRADQSCHRNIVCSDQMKDRACCHGPRRANGAQLAGLLAFDHAAGWWAPCRPDRGVWLHNACLFGTIAESRKARNLAANFNCVVCPNQADEAVIVEGVAEQVIDATLHRQFHAAYATK
jgi:hypothetical protein